MVDEGGVDAYNGLWHTLSWLSCNGELLASSDVLCHDRGLVLLLLQLLDDGR